MLYIKKIIYDFWNSWTMINLRISRFKASNELIIRYLKNAGISIGNNCKIYSRITTPESYLINIGNNVTIATGAKFITHDNSICKVDNRYTDFFGKIVVGDNVFIGAYSIILPGVTIGNNSIVASGAVVTKSIPSNVIVGGNPAKIISNIDKLKEKTVLYGINTDGLSFSEKYDLLMSTDRLIKK